MKTPETVSTRAGAGAAASGARDGALVVGRDGRKAGKKDVEDEGWFETAAAASLVPPPPPPGNVSIGPVERRSLGGVPWVGSFRVPVNSCFVLIWGVWPVWGRLFFTKPKRWDNKNSSRHDDFCKFVDRDRWQFRSVGWDAPIVSRTKFSLQGRAFSALLPWLGL